MKIHRSRKFITIPLAVLLGVGVGVFCGWLVWGPAKTLAGKPGRQPGMQSTLSKLPHHESGTAKDNPAAAAAATSEIIRGLSPEAFGRYLADAWDKPDNPEAQLRRALCLMEIDAERATAFYQEYKRRKGLQISDNAGDIRSLITVAGRKDGRRFMEAMLRLAPEGAPEMDSLIHGWASTDAEGSVEWLNALPEGTPIYPHLLRGLMWGLAETSPATAATVLQSLAAEDRTPESISSVAESTYDYHGLTGLNSMLAGVEDASLRRALATATGTGRAMNAKPSQYVAEMAQHVTLDNAALLGTYTNMSQRWVAAAPQEALEWLQQAAQGPAGAAALQTVTQQLASAGSGDAVARWLAANPQAPGGAAIRRALESAVR